MKKIHFSVSFVFSILVFLTIFGSIISCTSNPSQNKMETFDTGMGVYTQNDRLLFELLGIKDILIYTTDGKDVELIVYETSSGIDFVKIRVDNSMVGIRSEYAWADRTYPGFVRQGQRLINVKINGLTLPCDVLIYKNSRTGEEIEMYFEISDFFGKW